MARTRYKNAVVWTGFGNPLADVLTIGDDRIISNDSEVDFEIDCGGRAILPAFIDGHSHPSIVAKSSLGPDVTHCKSIGEVVECVSNWIAANPSAKWAVGGSYDRSMAPGGLFRAKWLDDASLTVPIVLHASDQHTIWVNTAALTKVELPDSLPPGVEIGEDGRPTGMFFESEAKNLILDAVPAQQEAELVASVERQLEHLLSLGVIATLDAWGDDSSESIFDQVRSPVRMERAIAIHPGKWRSLSSVRTAKFFVDGVLGAKTALVTEPYVTDHSHGNSFWDMSELLEALTHFNELGCRLHLHAIGDGGVQIVIDAIRTLGSTKFPATIAHAELLLDDQITALSELSVFVCAQPLWARVDSLSVGALENLGTLRSSKLYRHKDLLNANGLLSFGSDWPVSSPNPLLGLFTAIYRCEPGSEATLNIDQSISIHEAIRAYTETPARQLGFERVGRLEIGYSADFVMLSGNPFIDNGKSLPSLFVDQTISGGQTLFTRR